MQSLPGRSVGPVLVFTAVSCAIAGCGSGNEADKGPAAGAAESPPAQAAEAQPIDACSLLSAEDVSALLGTTVEGKRTSIDPAGCTWENPQTYESVAVEIGNAGTAVNGLPPPEPGFPEVGTPGPDGMRFLASGQVEFAAGGRSNMVQVAVMSMSTDEANNAAVDLARKIGPQLPT